MQEQQIKSTSKCNLEDFNIQKLQIPNQFMDQRIGLQSQYENQLVKEGTQEYSGRIWDYNYYPPKPKRTNYQVTINNDKIIYSQNGLILKSDEIIYGFQKPQIFENLEQIQHLKWIGEYNQNNKREGYWTATWKGEPLQFVGGWYSNDGKKEGSWKDICTNFWNHAQIYEVGQYESGKKQGFWKYYLKDLQIGGGYYNEKGLKQGKWIELFEGFSEFAKSLIMAIII